MSSAQRWSADAAAAQVRDGDLVAISGNGEMLVPDAILEALERRFLKTGSPRDLQLVYTVFPGGKRPGTGIERLAHVGIVSRVYAGSYYSLRATGLSGLVAGGTIEAYLLPYGFLHAMLRSGASDEPGALLRIGLDTFLDPAGDDGSRLTTRTPPLLMRTEVAGEPAIFAPALRPDVAIVRASEASVRGDLSLRLEPGSLAIRPLVMATKAGGGRVFAQVARVVADGSLHPRDVAVPSPFVSALVEAPDQMAPFPYRPDLTGDVRSGAVPTLDEPPHRAAIVERASRELRPGDLANVGMGLAASVPATARRLGRDRGVLFTTEHGPIGGLPNDREHFGPAVDPLVLLDSSRMFELIDQGRLDVSFLGMGEVDEAGNVNVAHLAGRYNMGGFVDIVHATKRIVFCGTFRAKGLDVERNGQRIRIVRDGAVPKFVRAVTHRTFDAALARRRGQDVRYVTERAVFELGPHGPRLIEVADGVDVERDVLSQMEFTPDVALD